MFQKLADETLSAILSYSLSVDDADFACTTRSPFANDALSSSTILLVCKRWMRVATPLLYETVIVRSKGQSAALAGVLKRNKAFGTYIRKIRVEGGVGASICKIFAAAPNITDLCLTLDLYADANVGAMYNSLFDRVSPRRLVLCNPSVIIKDNKAMALATSRLEYCITNWKTLRIIAISDRLLVHSDIIFRALCKAKHLDLIHIPQADPDAMFPEDILSRLAARCSAPRIRVGWPSRGHDGLGRPQDMRSELSDVAQRKVEFLEPLAEQSHTTVLPSDPSYTPLTNVSQDIRRAIWTRVLRLVITHTSGVDKDVLAEELWERILNRDQRDQPRLPRGPVLQCMYVCKEWRDLAIPIACKNLRLVSETSVLSFIACMRKHDDLPVLVHTLKFSDDSKVGAVEKLCDQLFLLPFCNLRSFDGGRVNISPNALESLSTAQLDTLRIHTHGFGPLQMTYKIPSFPSLRTLRWVADLSIEHEGPEFPAQGHQASFPLLDNIEVLGAASSKILACLTHCRLPSLRSITFHTVLKDDALRSFCVAHGDQLQTVINHTNRDMLEIIIPNCRNLKSLMIDNAKVPDSTASIRRLSSPHTALEEITCGHLGLSAKFSPRQESSMRHLSAICDALEQTKFPALRTLRLPVYHIWPTTQHEIAKHPLPAIAETLLERGIRLMDRSGMGWKRRLK